MDHELTVTLPPQPIYRRRRPDAAGSGGRQPAEQRLQVHRQGRAHLARRSSAKASRPSFACEDNGIGIAADQLPRLFEMFTQVDTSLERSRDGLGIGLTLVKTLVEMHGGTVEAHSDGPGHGSEFVVRLPILADGAEVAVAARPQNARRSAPAPAHPDRRRQRGRRAVARHAAEARRPRDAHGARRPRGDGGCGAAPPRRRAARHRPAGARTATRCVAASASSRGART